MDTSKHPKLIIMSYYEHLRTQVDIYAEKLLSTCDPEGLIREETSVSNPYRFGNYVSNGVYTNWTHMAGVDLSEPIHNSRKVVDFVHESRMRAIEELKKAEQETLRYYETIKADASMKRNQDLSDKEMAEKWRSQIFAKKFCFLIELDHPTKLLTLVADYYLNQNQIDLIV
jgi:hypothetical protein